MVNNTLYPILPISKVYTRVKQVELFINMRYKNLSEDMYKDENEFIYYILR